MDQRRSSRLSREKVSDKCFSRNIDLLQKGPVGLAVLRRYFALLANQRGYLQIHQRGDAAAQGDLLTGIKAEYRIDERDPLLPFRQLAEDMHPVLDLGVANNRKEPVSLFGNLAKVFMPVIQIDLFVQIGLFDLVDDHMLQAVRPGGVGDAGLLVFLQEAIELGQLIVEAAFGHHGLHMVHESGVAPSLGDDPLRRVVGIVDIEVGQRAYPQIGIAIPGEPRTFARQKFEVAMGAHVHDHIGAEIALEIAVRGHILVRRRDLRIVQYFADPPVAAGSGAAAFGLNADNGMAVAHPGHQDLALVNHRRRHPVQLFPRRPAPGLADPFFDLRREGVKPFAVFFHRHQLQRAALADDLIGGGPAKLRDGFAIHDLVDQLPAAAGIFDGIAFPPHLFEDSGNALQRIQTGAASHRRLHRGAGVVVQNKGNFALCYGSAGQADPFCHPADQMEAALPQGIPEFQSAVPTETADKKGLDHPFKFGHGDGPGDLAAQTLGIGAPLIDSAVKGDHGLKYGNI